MGNLAPKDCIDGHVRRFSRRDGSCDIYFVPKPPKGYENNRIETVRGKGWFVLLRLYRPLGAWYNKTWRPGEIELVK